MILVNIDVQDITKLQQAIMEFIMHWGRVQKKSIPQQVIVLEMGREGVKDFTTVNALKSLMKKGYIRRGYEVSNRTTYVQIRSI